nr:MAG TPA: hypothetical protein [Caudoviricetes sp.]
MFKYTVVSKNREKAPIPFTFRPRLLVYACLVIKIDTDF